MSHRAAIRWQMILLFGGFLIGLIGVSVSAYLLAAGLILMCLSALVWWKYYRCPVCHVHLGRGKPRHCPGCGAWLGDGPEPEEKKKVQHKKKRR